MRARITRGPARLLAMLAMVALAASCAGQELAKPSTTTGTTAPVETTTTTEVPLDGGRQLFVYTPKVGDCYDKRQVTSNDKKVDVILQLDCKQPHQHEIFALIDYPLPDTGTSTGTTDPKAREFPGDETLRRYAKAECPKPFADYVGRRYELSKIEIGFLLPAQSTWPSIRAIGCYAYDPSGRRLDISVRGSQR